MPRIPAAPVLILIAALAILIAPRGYVMRVLAGLRPEQAPIMVSPADPNEIFKVAYPPSLFSETLDRAVAPVYAVSAGYRNELAIAQGTDRGIRAGDPVLLVDLQTNPVPTLVGMVRDASRSTASVQTLSDPAWRSAVRIGTSSVDALLVGGLSPTLTTIPKGAPVAVGDTVISADANLPYGLFVGTVAEIHDARDGVLREATLALPYAVTSLRAVDVVPSGDAVDR